MKKIAFLFALILLLVGCSSTEKENSSGLKVGNMSTSSFADNKKYFIITYFEWVGEKSAKIESIELIKQGERPVTVDEDRISYTFYGADPYKAIGIYQREQIGEVEDIEGFEVQGESKLILEVVLTNVKADSNRKMKINYIAGGEKKEQIIESTMIANLRTE